MFQVHYLKRTVLGVLYRRNDPILIPRHDWNQILNQDDRPKYFVQGMKPSDRLPAGLISDFNHFVNLKLSTAGLQKSKQDVVCQCLGSNILLRQKSAPPLVQPDYTADEGFWKTDDYLTEARPLSWTEFRLLLAANFMDYVSMVPILGEYIGFSAKARARCAELLAAGGKDPPSWAALMPKMLKQGPAARERSLFQMTKNFRTQNADDFIVTTRIQNVLRNFMVEDVVAFLQAVFPGLDPTKKKIEDRREGSIIYYSLNAHINWMNQARHHILNTGESLAGPIPAGVYDLRCGECHRLITTRRVYRGGSLRNNGPIYSADSHTFISSCCEHPLFKCPLSVNGTILAVHIPGSHMYTLSPEDGSIKQM